MVKNYVLRGEWYHYNRRVPKTLAGYDKRSHIRIALKTKDAKEARRLAAIYDDFVEKYWSDLVRTGRQDESLSVFEHSRSLAKAHGFAYKNIAEVANSPLDEILSRVEALTDNSKAKRRALLGGAGPSNVRLSECIDRFWPLCADRFTDKSEDQIRKYKNPRIAAIQNFMGTVGNLAVNEIERSHILAFRQWLMERIAKGEITGNTGNKQIGQIKDILRSVGQDAEIETDFAVLFAETRLQKTMNSRPPFESDFVRKRFLDGKSLEGLNSDARMLVYMMIETGARVSEIIGLTGDDFVLEAEIPYIWIRKNNIRSLKTKSSERRIPLVGSALLAAQQIFPDGITRYQDKPDHASGAINKYLLENALRPTPQHTLYSLRHTFKDRLRDAGAPEEVIDELMGHRKSGPKYGRGHMLETKQKWLQKIAFEPPQSF